MEWKRSEPIKERIYGNHEKDLTKMRYYANLGGGTSIEVVYITKEQAWVGFVSLHGSEVPWQTEPHPVPEGAAVEVIDIATARIQKMLEAASMLRTEAMEGF